MRKSSRVWNSPIRRDPHGAHAAIEERTAAAMGGTHYGANRACSKLIRPAKKAARENQLRKDTRSREAENLDRIISTKPLRPPGKS